MKSIEVNNGRHLVIVPDAQGVTIEHRSATGTTESAEHVSDGEIVMLSNMVRHMRENGATVAYIKTAAGMEDFPILEPIRKEPK